MKKLISFFLSIAMVLSLAAAPIQAADEKVEFYDQAFEEFMIMNFDRNQDGQITQSELEFNGEYADVVLGVSGDMDYVPAVEQVIGSLYFGNNVKHLYIRAQNMPVHNLDYLFNLAREDMMLDLFLIGAHIYEYDPQFTPEQAVGEISLTLDGCSIDGDLSICSNYNITRLHIYRCWGEDVNWFSGEHIRDLYIDCDCTDIGTLVQTASNLEYATVPSDLARVIPAEAPLREANIYDTSDSRFTNEDFRTFINNHSGLTSLSLGCIKVTDLSPLQNGNITSMTYSLQSYWYYYMCKDLFIDGKPLGDYILEQLVEIPSIQFIRMEDINVTDLTPCSGVNKTFQIYSSWVDMNYKNNAAIKNSLTDSHFDWLTTYLYADDIIENYKDKKLKVEVKSNKKYFKPGETVTYSVKVTNLGSETVNVDLYNTLYKCTMVEGEAKQSINNLEPGKSATKRITVAVADNSNYLNGEFLIGADDQIIGSRYYPSVSKSNVVTLMETDFIKKD